MFVTAWPLIVLALQIVVQHSSLSCQLNVEQYYFMNYNSRAVTCVAGMNVQWTAGMIKICIVLSSLYSKIVP